MFIPTIARTEATVLWFSKNNKSVINTRNPKHKTAGRPSSWVLKWFKWFQGVFFMVFNGHIHLSYLTSCCKREEKPGAFF